MKKLTLSFLFLLPLSAWSQDALVTSGGDFKSLFNEYRVAQPKSIPWSGNFFPYGTKGTAVKLNERGHEDARGKSPMETYGKIMNLGDKAHKWEEENHSCHKLDKVTKKSCEAWWGHCNGWAAAAIKETEPRKAIDIKGTRLSVADQKGILSELWLASYSLNTGETDKNTKIGSWVHDANRSNSYAYQSFWDVSPKTFFMVFTNHIGAMKTGVVIDRHTGDEVWNQPVVGYRIMPIRKSDIKQVRDQGQSYWAVKMGVKIFWGNDLGISSGHLAKPFDIFKMTRDEVGIRPVTGEVEHISEDYEGRYLEFTLHFDREVEVNADGTKVLRAGRLVGDGIWEHQENSRRYTLDELKHSHPDFIWLPTNPYQDYSGYGNPYIVSDISRMISAQSSGSGGGSTSGGGTSSETSSKVVKLSFNANDFRVQDLTEASVKRAVKKVFLRDGIKTIIASDGIEFSASRVYVTVELVNADIKHVTELFQAAGLPFRVLQ